MLRVRFSEKSKQLIVAENRVMNYFELIDKQCLDIFLPSHRKYTTVVPDIVLSFYPFVNS